MTFSQMKIEQQLARKVGARKRFLDKVVSPIVDLVHKRGKVNKREQGSSHTRVVSELINFGDFTFETDLGQTMFSGDTIRVWHHPHRNFREGGLDYAHDKEWTPVLDVYYQDRSDYKVGAFRDETDWQRALIRVLKNQNKIAARIKKTQDKASKTLRNWRQADERKDKLAKEAQKLGLS